MLPRTFCRPQLVCALLTALAASAAQGQVLYYKADNTNSLNQNTSWVDQAGATLSTTPSNTTSSPDTWFWDNRLQVLASDGVSAPVFNAGGDLGVRHIVILDPAYKITINGGGNRTITVANGGSIDLTAATQDLQIENLNTSSNAVGLRLPGSGTTLNLLVPAARTLTVNATVAVQSSAGNANLVFTGAGRVVLNGEVRPTNVTVDGGTLELNRSAGSARIGTPNTTINNGTLIVRNTSGSATGGGTVNLNAGSTLTGAGILTSTVNPAADSLIAPGDAGIGTLQVGSLNLVEGSVIAWEANNSAEADALNVSATNGLTINGGTIRLYQPGTTQPFAGTGTFKLIGFNGAVQGAGVGALTIDPATKIEDGRIYNIVQVANEVTLQILTEAVPTRSWSVNASGNWSTASNWTGAVVPNAPGAIAHLSGPAGATLTAPRTITIDTPQTVGTLLLDSTQAITLANPGPLTLDGAGATASVGAAGADHVVTTPLVLTSGGALTSVETGRTLTLAGVVDGVGFGLAKLGSGTLLLTANNTYTGNTNLSGGLLQIGAGGASGSISGAIVNNAALRFNRSGSLTLGGGISGTGTVEFAGAGDITLPFANTYTGDTSLSSGTLVLAHQNALQNTSLNYSQGGGTAVIASPLTAVTLGALGGDRAFPVLNTDSTPVALAVGGNNASTTYTASSAGTGLSLTKNGTGTFTLTGSHTFSGNLLVNNGIVSLDQGASLNVAAASLGAGTAARILVNGGTLTASAASEVINNTGGIVVAGGVANFNGGITNPYSESLNALVHVTGGVLNATSISLGRGNLNNSAEEPPGNGQTASGLYINGGTVNLSAGLNIGVTTNSSATARIDSGALNSAGPITIGINNIARWSTLDVNGGTLNANHESGIQLGGPTAGRVVMHVRNASAVVNTPRIQFGQGDLAGRSILSLAAGSLYVGSGGLALGSTDETFVAQLRLNGGTLGATADWSSTIPVSLAGNVQLTATDSANQPHTIRLQGPVSGIGAFTKTGSGTVVLDNPANNFFGPANIQSGRLELAGYTNDVLTLAAGATLAPRGALTAEFGAALNGRLVIRYDRNAETPVSRLQANFEINIGTGAQLAFEGTGALTEPAYVIAKSVAGINGTFASVTGLPSGYTLDYNYMEEGATYPSIAIVGGGTLSPYEQWLDANSLTGDAALPSADPDADGLPNLLEYALGTSPSAATSTSDAYVLSRSGNVLTLGFDQPGDASLVYSVEATNDLASGSWTTVHTFPSFTAAGAALYTDTANLTTTPRRFLRLKVAFAP